MNLPSTLVEAAARGLHAHDLAVQEPSWSEMEDYDRDSYRSAVCTTLAAALSTCTVREEWRAKITYEDGGGGHTGWVVRPDLVFGVDYLTRMNPGARTTVERRLVIETEGEETK
jgi:hypothetical protein